MTKGEQPMEVTALQRAWGRFSGWLAENAPDDYALLLPPATDHQIAEIEQAHGFALHPELKDLLRLNAGTPWNNNRPALGCFLPWNIRLLSVEEIIGERRMSLNFHEDFPENWGDWRKIWSEEPVLARADKWVVFAADNGGSIVFIDHAPGPTYGHVYRFGMGGGSSEAEHWATSLSDLFDSLTTAITTGTAFHGTYPAYMDFHKANHAAFEHLVGKSSFGWTYSFDEISPEATFTLRGVTSTS